RIILEYTLKRYSHTTFQIPIILFMKNFSDLPPAPHPSFLHRVFYLTKSLMILPERKVDITQCKYYYTCAGTYLHRRQGGDTQIIAQKTYTNPSGMPSSSMGIFMPEIRTSY
ncbi:MAG: hypothetical protein V1862_09340, partial [Methanobacteriota archaeon]